ncbi:hypothetical protein F0562_018786 [Nyssa sinensis]|uniref:Biotin synthase n=1 Tax=Nyssa sinensis TaxID=561372 RepID=A0A5J4Z9Z3_9ASTE|nr:hypothetical protein F0562_018786 [Nyssa sinensis]
MNRWPSSTLLVHLHYSSATTIQAERTIREGPRNDWTRDEIKSIYDFPVLDLLFHGAQVHRHAHNFIEVQQCTLLSIKTGGCSKDCSYCPQSSRGDGGDMAYSVADYATNYAAAAAFGVVLPSPSPDTAWPPTVVVVAAAQPASVDSTGFEDPLDEY